MSPHSTSARPAAELIADGYVRVSRVAQADGHSPEVQREAIKALIAQRGWKPGIIEEDHESGGKVTRKGYQKIVKRVEERVSHVVVVFMLDRWGRDAVEWLQRAKRFDLLGAELISVREGRDERGLMRYIRAGMAEEEAIKIAVRSRVPREISARAGVHCGPTPFGYRRVYPEWDGRGKRPPGLLVPHEPADEPQDRQEAWIVRELFARYATGTWSLRRLADWLNGLLDEGGPRPPSTTRQHRPGTSRPAAERWGADTLRTMLKNPVFAGMVRYDHRPNGRYETAGPGSEFTVGGKHEALVSSALFDEVQRRLELARSRSYNTLAPQRRFLLAGLVRCHMCGGPMMPIHRDRSSGSRGHGSGELACRNYRTGASRCPGTGLRLDVAEEALLAQVSRLRGAPWTVQHDQLLTGDAAGRLADLERSLAAAREALLRHTRRMHQAVTDPSPAEMAVFRQVSAELAASVERLEKQVSAQAGKAEHLPRLRALHERLRSTEVPQMVQQLRAAGKDVELRDLTESLVASAVVVARWPERHSTWARMEVTWTDDALQLREHGLLWLEPEQTRPQLPPGIEKRRARQRRYYAERCAREAAR